MKRRSVEQTRRLITVQRERNADTPYLEVSHRVPIDIGVGKQHSVLRERVEDGFAVDSKRVIVPMRCATFVKPCKELVQNHGPANSVSKE